MSLKNILKAKTVSVWGIGYLGYTTMIKLQNSGFNIVVYEINEKQLKKFSNGRYPDKEQTASWSRMGYLPKLDYTKIKIAKNPKELFESSHVHMIASPEPHGNNAEKDSVVARLAEVFSQNLKRSKNAPLIVFESAFVPGHIEKNFVEKLKKHGLTCSENYYLGTLFRTDWNVEAFIAQSDKMPIAGYCAKSLQVLREFVRYLSIPTVEFNNIRESEIYTNSINAIQAMADDFIRQLAIGYPSVSLKRISKLLFDNVTLEDCTLNIGTGGTRMTLAVDNLIKGSNNPGSLTLLKELQNINISSVLNYGEFIIRRGYKSVAILGIAYKGNQKDLTLSPSITLADYLIKNSIKVFLNDTFCTKNEITRLAKGAKVVAFPDQAFSADVLILASDHNEYKHLSQLRLGRIDKKTRLIIDNCGIWSHLKFGKTKYHQIGDGSLNLLK